MSIFIAEPDGLDEPSVRIPFSRVIPRRIINLYAGPGTGKSTTMAALFAELKYRGYNTEMITEVAKDAAWEGRGEKFFRAQDYIFGKQHFRIQRTIDDVEFLVTDAPLLQNLVYGKGHPLFPELQELIRAANRQYESIDVFLARSDEKPYNPKGRFQTEEQARAKDQEIMDMLDENLVDYYNMTFGRHNVKSIINIMEDKGWLKASFRPEDVVFSSNVRAG